MNYMTKQQIFATELAIILSTLMVFAMWALDKWVF